MSFFAGWSFHCCHCTSTYAIFRWDFPIVLLNSNVDIWILQFINLCYEQHLTDCCAICFMLIPITNGTPYQRMKTVTRKLRAREPCLTGCMGYTSVFFALNLYFTVYNTKLLCKWNGGNFYTSTLYSIFIMEQFWILHNFNLSSLSTKEKAQSFSWSLGVVVHVSNMSTICLRNMVYTPRMCSEFNILAQASMWIYCLWYWVEVACSWWLFFISKKWSMCCRFSFCNSSVMYTCPSVRTIKVSGLQISALVYTFEIVYRKETLAHLFQKYHMPNWRQVPREKQRQLNVENHRVDRVL